MATILHNNFSPSRNDQLVSPPSAKARSNAAFECWNFLSLTATDEPAMFSDTTGFPYTRGQEDGHELEDWLRAEEEITRKKAGTIAA